MRAVTAQSDLRQLVAAARGTGATGIKIYADLPPPLVRAVTAEAHRQGLRVWAHAFVPPTRPSEMVAAGADVLSHVALLGFEAADPLPATYVAAKKAGLPPQAALADGRVAAVLEAMAARGTILDATLDVSYLTANGRIPREATTWLARQAHVRGVAICAGTDDDGEDKAPDSRLLTELERFVSELGMTPREALQAATVNGARALGASDVMGTLEPGKQANFVVLGQDPLADVRHLRSVERVVRRGTAYERDAADPARADIGSAPR
jgi:imidazolonepropionase-like amidohydrolase